MYSIRGLRSDSIPRSSRLRAAGLVRCDGKGEVAPEDSVELDAEIEPGGVALRFVVPCRGGRQRMLRVPVRRMGPRRWVSFSSLLRRPRVNSQPLGSIGGPRRTRPLILEATEECQRLVLRAASAPRRRRVTPSPVRVHDQGAPFPIDTGCPGRR